jgi:hypothetical protein
VATVCPAAAPPRQADNDAEVTFPIEIRAGGKPLRLGQEVVRGDGAGERFTLFHAFLANPHLVDASGQRVPAQLTDGRGSPLPYGLMLLDGAKPAPLALVGPAGDYAALELGVGVPPPCNGGDPTRKVFPLNADGDMYWSWGSQYLFVRLEGFLRAPRTEGPWQGLQLHLGFDALYRTARLAGPVALRPGTGRTIVFDLDGLIQPDPGGPALGSGDISPEWVVNHISAGSVLFFAP